MRRQAGFRRRTGRAFLFAVVSVLLPCLQASAAQQMVFTFDPAATKIQFTLGAALHTVHGTMHLKSGEIRFDPATGSARGEVIVDASSAETGNKSRDAKMHKEVLQSARYPMIAFTPQRLAGIIQSGGASRVQLSGLFEIDGRQHPITLSVDVDRTSSAAATSAMTKFSIPYVRWGLTNPSTFFLRVSDRVDMEIDASGQLVKAH